MNEHPPLEPVGDASLEARIVAWVLGEATAFEAGELERLCEERPELLVFRRRMRALHGLLSEAESAESDEAWKLPPAKRAKIEELFGESPPQTTIPVLQPEKVSTRWLLKTILTAAACVMFGMLYRFGFDATKSSSILAVNEKSVDFSSSGGGGRITSGSSVEIIGGSTFDVAPASRASRPLVVDGRSDENGQPAGQKQNLQAAEGGFSYKATAAQAVADSESIAAASKSKMEVIREFNYSNEYEPPELPNSVAFSGKVQAGEPAAPPQGAAKQEFEGSVNFGSPINQVAQADPFADSIQDEGMKLAARRSVSEQKPIEPTGGWASASGPESQLAQSDELRSRRVEIEGESATRDRVIRREVPTSPTGETGAAFGGGQGGAMLEADEAVLPELTKNGVGNLELSGGSDYNGRTQATAGVLGIDGTDRGEMADSTKGEKSPISGGQDDTSILTGGLRSGDAAINRNSIDSVLNNPNRSNDLSPAGPPADKPGEPSGELAELQSLKPAMPAAQPAPAPAAVAPPKPEAPKEKMMSDGIVWSDPDSPKKTSEDLQSDQKSAPEEASATSLSGLAQREMIRRQNSVTEGDRLLMEGRDAFTKGDYQQASEKYKKALEAVPNAPALADRRESYGDHLNDANVALAQQYRKVGKYDEARALLGEVLKPGSDPENADAKREMEWLEDPIRTNSALTYEHTKDVDKVRKGLYTGEGNYNLGKFDDAKRDYENVLRTDPYNSAARRGLEKIASAKSDYYRAAYDQSRAQLLMEVDKDWELTDAKDSAPTAMFDNPLRKNKAAEGAIDVAADYQDYDGAKRDLDSAKKMLEVAKQTAPNQAAQRRDHLSLKDLDELRKSVRDQEDKVEERRKLMKTLLPTKLINPTTEEGRKLLAAQERERQIETEKIQLQSQIKALLNYSNEQLMVYAAGIDLPDNAVKKLYPQYLDQKRKLDELKTQGFAESHPTFNAQAEKLRNIQKDLEEGVTTTRETLMNQLDMADARLGASKIKTGEKDLSCGLDLQVLVDAKKELEASEAKLDALREKLVQETIAQQIQSNQADLPKILREHERKVEERQKLLNSIENANGITPTKPSKPAPAPVPIPTDELSANAEAFSTFSLHVSDASFKVAKAALDRGERPDPESVRPEEFYNAFDYGDPTPAPGEPVACAIEQAAHPILPQRNLVRVAMRTGAAGRAASQPLNLTVLLDHSGSMEREDRHEGLNQAIFQLASLLKAGDTITVAGFSRTPRLMADRLPGERAKELVDIVRNTPSEGGTNLEEALKLGGDLALRQKNPAAQNRIVLLTDGAANLGNAKPEDLAERIRALRQQGISFDAAGLGAGGVNDRMLETLTRDGNGRYYLIDQPSDADANFAKQLAGAFRPAAENVKVQVHFNPARVGRYKLIGFEKHRLKTEDFRNDKVDAAELAAEEAGVAIYQVETLPQGTGEIGEASVRFKDTSTGQMVEQSWTIPYDEKAAAFDQAVPSMQLASLASLAAEKLRGGPLAEAIDIQSLTPQVAKVRAHYSTSKKVGDLIEMIGKLK